MNLVQIAERLKGVPKDFLIKEANPNSTSGRYPAYLIYAELKRRISQEKMFANAEAADNPPQETVAERTMREATPMPTPMAAMQGLKSPRTTYQEEPSGQETMGIPGAVRMFEGGRVSFNTGLSTDLNEKLKQLEADLGKARTNPRLYGIGTIKKIQDDIDKTKKAMLAADPYYTRGLKSIEELQEEIDQTKGRIAVNPRLYGTEENIAGLKNLEEQLAIRKTMTEPTKEGIASKPTEQFMALKPELVDANAVLTRKKEFDRRKEEEREVTEEQNTNLSTIQQKEEKVSEDIIAPKQKGIDFGDVKKLYNDLSNEIKFETMSTDIPDFSYYKAPTYEEFTLQRNLARKNDFLGAMQGKIDELKSQSEKDRVQALDMFKLETGLAILSAPSQGKGFGGLLSTVSKALGTPLNQLKQTMQAIKAGERDITKSEMQLLQAYDARQEGDLQAFEAEKLKERESKLNAENKKAEAIINITRDNTKITNDGISLLYNTALKITTTDAQIEQSNLDRQTKLDVQKINRDAAIRVAQIQTEYKGRENTRAAILEQRKVLMKAFNKMKENLADTGYDEAKITEFMQGYQAEIKELDRRYNALFGKVPITGEPTTGSVKNYVDITPAKRELGLQ